MAVRWAGCGSRCCDVGGMWLPWLWGGQDVAPVAVTWAGCGPRGCDVGRDVAPVAVTRAGCGY